MNWNNLVDNCCPNCGADWDEEKPKRVEIQGGIEMMTICDCDFKITDSKKESIIENIEDKKFNNDWD